MSPGKRATTGHQAGERPVHLHLVASLCLALMPVATAACGGDGAPGADGSASGGAGGSAGGSAGGASGRGGAGGAPGHLSAGCGMAASGTSNYVRETITVHGAQREYYLYVPRTYDASQPYPIIFRWHGSGGNGTSGGLEIEASSGEKAIIASPSGLNGDWDFAPTGVDVQLFDALLADLESRYCVDTDRVFSYGFSDGAGFTNLLGCVRTPTIRAVAPVEGWAPETTCNGPVAAWITHSVDDDSITIDQGRAARDLYVMLNGCGSTTKATTPSPCIAYQDCLSDDPVVWCQTTGPHSPQGSFTGPGAWAFFDSLP